MSETCSVCGEEVRFGTRGAGMLWLHREDRDHLVRLGYLETEEDRAEIERQYDLPRVKDDGTVYTTRESDLERYMKNLKFREARERETKDDIEVATLPPLEIECHTVKPDVFAPRSGAKQVCNLLVKQGWEIRRLTHTRGPYVGVDGKMLSISDVHQIAARGPARLDGGVPVAVGSWRDGKFDFAYIGTLKAGHLEPRKVDATEMKLWIKLKGLE